MRSRIALAVAAAVSLAAAPAGAAAPPPGSLLGQFVRNQFQNCSVICPYAAQGAATVPAGAVAAPGAFLGAATESGDPLAALGSGASLMTGPADAAMTGIIGNDLNQVVPRFQNGVLIAMVDLLRIGGGTGSVDGLRSDLLAALREPLPPTAPTPPPLTTPPVFGTTPQPRGPVEVTAVEATNVFFAAAFYVPELSLLGVTQTADAAASTLASTGDPVAAVGAGADAAREVTEENVRIVADTTSRAASNIADAMETPAPAERPAPSGEASASDEKDVPAETSSTASDSDTSATSGTSVTDGRPTGDSDAGPAAGGSAGQTVDEASAG
ncbi:hypothetical protein [Tsukamurella sp. 1534]|uniref:hypothetical protein n=1 Tax=Tsukamurella sp. 1534 TaxID=1151061 RepID=UPI0006ACD093|nr:hypothetical protein [Tsukamurella sp. 1534]